MGSDRRQFFNQLVNVGALSGLAAMLPSDAFARVESSIRGETPATGVQLEAATDTTRTHTFHAHAHILGSVSGHPLTRDLGNHGSVHVPEEGGFRSQFLDGYKSGDGISFKSAYMHVAGSRSSKVGYGWVTLATAVVTGLNVHDVVTADLVFAQVSTEHPLEGYVPSVTFLGNRFENLRIAGRAVEPVSISVFVDRSPTVIGPTFRIPDFSLALRSRENASATRLDFPIGLASSTMTLPRSGSQARSNALWSPVWKARLPGHLSETWSRFRASAECPWST